MAFIILAYHGTESQVAWQGNRWVGDVSQADEYDSERVVRSEFRRIAARANLQHRDRAVVVENYGYTSEREVYHLDTDGMVVAGPLDGEVAS